jgi:Cu(I)/Ag(I) efflux system membrane fusion protein
MADSGTTLRPDHEPLPEGEEQAPPGTRTMAIVRWVLVALMAAAAAGTWIHHVASGGVLGEARALFRCPMHPTVVSPQKGECPICGMDLVAAGEGEKGAPAAGPPAGAAAGPAATAGERRYTCPMHPAFVTADPKARCPDCGMKLVPKDADAGAAEGAPAPVPGLTAVELNAERIQLIGMRTAVAARERLPSTLRTVGFVTAPESGVASVTARYTGWIETVTGDTGPLVE